MVWIVTRLVVRPITQTAITAEKLAAGNLDQRVSVYGEHQAARLGYSFNLMVDSLQEKIVQLERLSTLQQRFVADVSHELRTRWRRCVWVRSFCTIRVEIWSGS